MATSRKLKRYGAVLALAGGALVVDRVLLTQGTGPASAAASTAMGILMGDEPLDTGAVLDLVGLDASDQSFASLLERVTESHGTGDMGEIRDALQMSGVWQPEPKEVFATPDTAAPRSEATPAPNHGLRLRSVVVDRVGGGVATLESSGGETRMIRVGESVGRVRLVSVTTRSAVVEVGGRSVTLEIDTRPGH